jgi:hypothetical protein
LPISPLSASAPYTYNEEHVERKGGIHEKSENHMDPSFSSSVADIDLARSNMDFDHYDLHHPLHHMHQLDEMDTSFRGLDDDDHVLANSISETQKGRAVSHAKENADLFTPKKLSDSVELDPRALPVPMPSIAPVHSNYHTRPVDFESIEKAAASGAYINADVARRSLSPTSILRNVPTRSPRRSPQNIRDIEDAASTAFPFPSSSKSEYTVKTSDVASRPSNESLRESMKLFSQSIRGYDDIMQLGRSNASSSAGSNNLPVRGNSSSQENQLNLHHVPSGIASVNASVNVGKQSVEVSTISEGTTRPFSPLYSQS